MLTRANRVCVGFSSCISRILMTTCEKKKILRQQRQHGKEGKNEEFLVKAAFVLLPMGKLFDDLFNVKEFFRLHQEEEGDRN